MSNYVILTDSSADLTAAMVEELGVHVIPLTVLMGDNAYRNYPGNREIDPHDFYDRMRAGATATTSAINPGEFTEFMEPFLQEGKDVLVLAFSSGLSVTCNSACLAAEELSAKYPNRKVYVVDTLCASLGQGLLVYHAALQQKAGKTIEEVRDWAEDNKLHLCHWFTVDDLMHLKRGGRVSAATAVMGTMLQIKPVLHMNDAGKLESVEKARGRKAALNALVEQIARTAVEPEKQTMFISHSACREDAQTVADAIKARFGTPEVILNDIGPVIGAHTGVGCVALFFMANPR